MNQIALSILYFEHLHGAHQIRDQECRIEIDNENRLLQFFEIAIENV